MKRTLTCVLMFAIALNYACSDDESSGSDDDSFLSGIFSKGYVEGANCGAYALADDGSRAELLGDAETGSDGAYEIGVPPEDLAEIDVVEIVCTGGRYTDESTGEEIQLGDDEEMVSLIDGPEDGSEGHVTPFSHLAADRVKEQLEGGEIDLAGAGDAMTQAGSDVCSNFGMSEGFDPFLTPPADLSQESEGDEDSLSYGALLGAFSERINEYNDEYGQDYGPIEMVQSLSADFMSDGAFNVGGPADFVGGIDDARESFLGGEFNMSGFGESDFQNFVPPACEDPESEECPPPPPAECQGDETGEAAETCFTPPPMIDFSTADGSCDMEADGFETDPDCYCQGPGAEIMDPLCQGDL